jgi:nucleotide-binding universal stress UspA family protein
MMQVRRILFPIAFSAAGASMAPLVREMAERFKATVTVLHAVNLAPEYISGPAPDTPCGSKEGVILFSPALQELRAQQEQRLNEFARTHFSGIRHTERIEDGEPAAVIEWVATCENTDLIMMPTRGLGKFARLLLGSVTSKVLHDIACPVWTSVHRPDPVPALPGGYHSILCAVGVNSDENHIFNAASLFAQAYGAKVSFLHIQSPSNEQDRQITAQTIKDRFDRAYLAGGGGVAADVSVRVLKGDIAEGICCAARDEGADLLIVGRGHARERFSGALSHLYSIIRESPCPVLSV